MSACVSNTFSETVYAKCNCNIYINLKYIKSVISKRSKFYELLHINFTTNFTYAKYYYSYLLFTTWSYFTEENHGDFNIKYIFLEKFITYFTAVIFCILKATANFYAPRHIIKIFFQMIRNIDSFVYL